MANEVLVIGNSGSGKSTSYEHLNPKETFIVNVGKKPLPFKGWKKNYNNFSKSNPKGNYLETDDASLICNAMAYVDKNRPEIKNFLVDDGQYIMANEFMRKANEKGYQKFTDIASHMWKVVTTGKAMRENINFILVGHADTSTDVDGKTTTRFKTVGKLVDNVVNIEGMFTVVLFTEVKVEPNKTISHSFLTQTDGTNTAKSPRGMFPELKIENDLNYVINTANAYYNDDTVVTETELV